MKILGLDISSTTIGIGLLELTPAKEIKHLHSQFYHPPKKGSLFQRLKTTEEEMTKIISSLHPDKIIIEDILLFNKKSTMKTLTTLAIFNRLIGLMAYKLLGQDPTLLAVATIRASLRRLSGQKDIKKEDVLNIIESVLKIKLLEKKERGDMADALAVALCYVDKINK